MGNLTIAHVNTQTTWRGGERQVFELIKGLQNLGQNNILVCKASSELAKRSREFGIDTVHLPLRGEWDIQSAFKLRALVRERNIHIVHVHSSHAHTIALIALWGIHSCKLVVSRRVDFHIHSILSRLVKYGGHVDKIIAISDAIRRILIEDGVDPKLVVTIRSGFIPGEFVNLEPAVDMRKQLRIALDSVVICTVAALAPHKAHHVLVKAAWIVLQKHPDVIFIFAGEGETRHTIEKDIASLGLSDSVILLGFVEDVGSVYRASDIFAISSEEEGLCTSIFDAMYFRLPIVATRAGGIPEIVKDGVNGFIVPVNDYMSFAERLNILIEDRNKGKLMGLRSTEILEHNLLKTTVEKTLAVYQELWN